MSNILELFAPRKKRTNDGFDQDGRRTAYWIRTSGHWDEMMDDIYHCTSRHQIEMLRWYWSVRVEEELWNQIWIDFASREFDLAILAMEDALAAQQAE
jgi:hypothetical protein